MPDSYPCPCCGHLVFGGPPGSYELCPICFWEDDGLQLAFPMMEGGANTPSLYQCQQNFLLHGACENRFVRNVRKPGPDERRATGWRMFDPDSDPHLEEDSEVDDGRWKSATSEANLYYWEPGYWLSPHHQ